MKSTRVCSMQPRLPPVLTTLMRSSALVSARSSNARPLLALSSAWTRKLSSMHSRSLQPDVLLFQQASGWLKSRITVFGPMTLKRFDFYFIVSIQLVILSINELGLASEFKLSKLYCCQQQPQRKPLYPLPNNQNNMLLWLFSVKKNIILQTKLNL